MHFIFPKKKYIIIRKIYLQFDIFVIFQYARGQTQDFNSQGAYFTSANISPSHICDLYTLFSIHLSVPPSLHAVLFFLNFLFGLRFFYNIFHNRGRRLENVYSVREHCAGSVHSRHSVQFRVTFDSYADLAPLGLVNRADLCGVSV